MSKSAALPAGATSGHGDFVFAAAVVVVLTIFFLPMPPLVIDLGLVVSIALSVMILMLGLWIEKPLQFSSFPTILLVATMLRLALNIATTRLILSHGAEGTDAAGHVIAGFSALLMGGDFIIGLIIFIILTSVNFLVITKGATRIAEVGARFTLDAIPGKQMAIDADLSAGLIDEKEARARRGELEQESAFFGAMDGASKFVRGDAIAGIVILLVNIVGGIVLGMTRHGMSLADAADRFTKLSVGDGLVAQLPALVISLSAGLLVAKSGVRGSTERAIVEQFTAFPKVALVCGALMLALALFPGLPFTPFAILGGGLLVLSRHAFANAWAVASTSEPDTSIQALPQTRFERPVLQIACGRQVHLAIAAHAEFQTRIERLRRGVETTYGLSIPEIGLVEDVALAHKSYEVRLHGARIAGASVRPGETMVVSGDASAPVYPGEECREPAFGMRAFWYPETFADDLRRDGFSPVDFLSVVLTHVGETLRANLAYLLSYRETRRLFESLEPEYRRLLDDICPAHVSQSGLQTVLKSLLAERVSIRHLGGVLEAIAECLPHARRPEQIVEHARMRLANQICADQLDAGLLKVLRIGAKWESEFHRGIRRDAKGDIAEFDIEPATIEQFSAALATATRKVMDAGHLFVVLTTSDARPFVRLVVERLFPALSVLSQLELARGVEVQLVATIE